ncbi:hypothetical protein SeMB42_g07903, partial [Synchytrium endobioticum]
MDEENGNFLVETRSTTSVWTWGSNSNYVLGHQNSDNRQFPERVVIPVPKEIPASIVTLPLFQPHHHGITISRYHTAIATNQGLFTNGFGPGGRLGLCNEETQLRPTLVKGIEGEVQQVAVGEDHTVVITTSGRVFAFGSNRYGQLGYPTDEVVHEGNGFVGSKNPQEVVGALKKIVVMGIAAAKFHTAAFSQQGLLYTWGMNIGQLGHPAQPGASLINPLPRKVTSLPQMDIVQIAVTNNATAVLNKAHEVYVYAEFHWHKLSFSFASFPRRMRVYQIDTRPPHIVKIVGGSNQHPGAHLFAALSSSGDVFMWSPPDKAYAETWQQVTFPQKRPKRVWRTRKKHLAVRDIAIGIDSNLVVRTESGHVFIGTRRKEAKSKESLSDSSDVAYFKFNNVPYLQHITAVTASPNGAYAAIRVDTKPQLIDVPPPSLPNDMRRAFSSSGALSILPTDLRDTDDSPRGLLAGRDLMDDAMFDVLIECDGDIKLRAHSAILGARSLFFRDTLLRPAQPVEIKGDVKFNVTPSDGEGKPVIIQIRGCHGVTMGLVLELIYTGSRRRYWENILSDGKGSATESSPATVKAEYLRMLRLLHIDDINTSATMAKPAMMLSNSFKSLLPTQLNCGIFTTPPFADVMLRLKDGDVCVHQCIIASRCPFFDVMLGSGSRWTMQKVNGLITVALPHLSWQHQMDVVLLHVYSDGSAEDVFKNMEAADMFEWTQDVVNVLTAANELLLDRLKDQCASILAMQMDLTNVISLLEISDLYDSAKLMSACLDYLCWNIETAIETRLLEHVDPNLLTRIGEALRVMQVNRQPFVIGLYAMYRERARMLEEEQKLKRRVMHRAAAANLLSNSKQTDPAPSPPPVTVSPLSRPALEDSPMVSPQDPDSDAAIFEMDGFGGGASNARSVTTETTTDGKAKKIIWQKLDIGQPAIPLTSSASRMTSWSPPANVSADSTGDAALLSTDTLNTVGGLNNTAAQVKGWDVSSSVRKVSLKDIMEETETRKPIVSPEQNNPFLDSRLNSPNKSESQPLLETNRVLNNLNSPDARTLVPPSGKQRTVKPPQWQLPASDSPSGPAVITSIPKSPSFADLPFKVTPDRTMSQRERRRSNKSNVASPALKPSISTSPILVNPSGHGVGETHLKNTGVLTAWTPPDKRVWGVGNGSVFTAGGGMGVKSMKQILEEEELWMKQSLETRIPLSSSPSLLSGAFTDVRLPAAWAQHS